MKSRACRGISLIEMIVVMVLVSAAAVPLLSLYGVVVRSLPINEDTQTAAQLAQECAEHVLAARRNPAVGYGAIDNSICNVLPPPLAGFARKVEVTDLAASPPCTVKAAGTCKKVEVSVSAQTTEPTRLTFMLVNY